MLRYFYTILILFILLFFSTETIFAQTNKVKDLYVLGEIEKVFEEKTVISNASEYVSQSVQIRILEGEYKDRLVQTDRTINPKLKTFDLKKGEKVVVNIKVNDKGDEFYSIFEPYRLDGLMYAVIGFLILIFLVGGKKGIGAFAGLVISLLIISQWVIPQIVSGSDPVRIVVIGACVILFFTTYIAHGFNLKTSVAVAGTALSLIITGWLSTVLTGALSLTGLGNEDIYQLQSGANIIYNTQGILLGAILIGTLGALNDITTTQAITIFTIVKENPKQNFFELFRKGMDIGKEHIASMVNTLVLAYAGSSIGIFIFIALNPASLPWWVILNNETTMEEIIATIAGSSALILAVPITTFLASYIALKGISLRELVKNI